MTLRCFHDNRYGVIYCHCKCSIPNQNLEADIHVTARKTVARRTATLDASYLKSVLRHTLELEQSPCRQISARGVLQMLTPLVTPTAEKNDDKGPCPNRDAYRPAPRCGRWSCLPCDNAENPGSAKQMASELSSPECCRPDSLIGEFCDSEKVRTGISKRDRNSFKSGH